MNLAKLLAAIIAVESGGDDTAIGNHGEHGALQVRQCVLDDVNARRGTRYTLADMHVRSNAVQCATLYLGIWATKERLGRTPTDRDIALIFHHGPTGYRRTGHSVYWNLVKSNLKK